MLATYMKVWVVHQCSITQQGYILLFPFLVDGTGTPFVKHALRKPISHVHNNAQWLKVTNSATYVQYTPLSRMDIPGVRSCLIDRWRKTNKLQILQAAVCRYNVCVGQPSTHVLPNSKEESKRASFHSLFLHLSIGHDLTPGMSIWLRSGVLDNP